MEAEEYLLSCCLLDGGDTIARCLEARLAPEAFYFPPNRIIFEKLCALYQRSPPVGIEMLIEELRTAQQLDAVGGTPYLIQISARIPTTAQAVYFIEKVRELYLLRELIKVTTSTVEQCFAYQGGLEEFIDQVEQDIFRVTQDRISDAAKPMKEPAREAMTVINKLMMKKGELTGVASGFKDLDQLTFGFQKQEMIVLGGPPLDGQDLAGAQHCRGGRPAQKGRAGADADLFAGDERRAARPAHAVFPRQGQHQAVARGHASETGPGTAAAGGCGG